MKAQTEMEKTATRRIAKLIIEQAEADGWRHIKDEVEASAKISHAIARQSSLHGINALFIKSAIMRIQRKME